MDQDLSFRVIGRRLVLSAFFACLLFALPVQTSFAQSSERVRPVTINNQKQLENFGISATQIHELNSKVEQFNDRYKTHGSLIPALYLVDLSALEFDKILKEQEIEKVDYFVSSLPLSLLKKTDIHYLMSKVTGLLSYGGMFIQYQYSLGKRDLLKGYFPSVRLGFTPLNFPPAFIYYCTMLG